MTGPNALGITGNMYEIRSFILLLSMAYSFAQVAFTAPFVLESSADLRNDAVVDWSDFSTTDNTVIPDLHPFAPSDSGAPVKPWANNDSTVTIENSADSELEGVLLSNSGPGQIFFYMDRPVQGMGFWVESPGGGPVTYSLDCFAYGTGTYLTTIEVESPDGSPVFFGFVDSEARFSTVGFRSSTGNHFLISNLHLQLPVPKTVDPTTLPVTSTQTLSVSNTATYLHEGFETRIETPATDNAVDDNANAYDLSDLFPGLRGGDFIHFERLGYSRLSGVSENSLLGLFTQTEEIAAGREFRRVSTPLEAGTDFYTGSISNDAFKTPTNIPQDFRIGTSSFVSVPDRARYLLFSLAQPSPRASPLNVRISHIEHDAFLQWAAGQGMHGSNAHPDTDLDGDGLRLIEEFVFTKDPTVKDGTDEDFAFLPKLNPLAQPGVLSLIFGARVDAPVRYWAEFTSDLTSGPSAWERMPEPIDQPFSNNADATRALLITTDPDSGPVRFGRIVIEYTPRP